MDNNGYMGQWAYGAVGTSGYGYSGGAIDMASYAQRPTRRCPLRSLPHMSH